MLSRPAPHPPQHPLRRNRQRADRHAIGRQDVLDATRPDACKRRDIKVTLRDMAGGKAAVGKTDGKWDRIRARLLSDAAARERYEQTKRSVLLVRKTLRTIDEERERAGLSIAELAHRMGMHPSAVRRMLTAQASNPTLRTAAEVLDALGLELTLRRESEATTSAGIRRPSAANVP